MTFGIQGKVALLVIAATSASALLVARVLTHRATEVLREHEIVDLGDEAMLRGWELIDRIDGLRQDLYTVAMDAGFRTSVENDRPPEELNVLARSVCRRNWTHHLRVDLLTLDPEGAVSSLTLHEKALVGHPGIWTPDAVSLSRGGMWFSTIQRLQLTRKDLSGEPFQRAEPVIWGIAPLGPRLEASAGSARFIRILMTLHSPESPRHLFSLANAEGDQLVRPDEAAAADDGNDAVFLALGSDPRLLATLDRRKAASEDPTKIAQEPKVDRLVRSDFVPLASPFLFQEGRPGKSLATALDTMNDVELEAFLEGIQDRLGRTVRIGGMLSGVREIRLLARTRQELVEVRGQIEAELQRQFGSVYDRIDWRGLVECDEIHSWAVRLLVGDDESRSEYFLHYAVLDDELASSIEYEMLAVRYLAFLVAGGFGLIGFLFAMRFIRPLKQMTVTAQRITQSPRERLLREVAGLAQRLDLRRRDEVGDIARASKRLFEELLSFQEELEQRVHERTRELRRANLELENANEKLKSLSHEKDAFVAKVSHDLRQPLNAIFLQVEALGLSDLDEIQRKDVQRIRDHAARELNLVNDILEYQKIIMGAETLNRETIAIAPLLSELCATHRHSLGDRPVALSSDCPSDIGELVADERRLRQILGNLVGNACKFTRNGSIVVAARPQEIGGEAWIELTVSDTGRGMSPSEQAKAFVPFVSNKKDNAGGSGLGLSICRELVTQMGGKIGFVSELGKGTHFSVFLPRIPSSERYERREPEFDHSGLPGQAEDHPSEGPEPSGTVLIIDDDAKVREMLSRILTRDGHRVLTAVDGPEGLELAERHRPDAITLDVVMPGGLDGWEVLRRLKESPATNSIPVIMVSVMAEQEHALALEVEDYLVKPVDLDRLNRVIQRVTRRIPQRNLLLVDDDEDSLKAMSRILEASGWSTMTARNGAEAFAVLAKTLPAAIVLDLLMPEMDGFEFIQRLRADPQLRMIPVIVMSGKDTSEAEQEFLRDRVEAVLRKGSHGAEQLLAAVKARLPQGRST